MHGLTVSVLPSGGICRLAQIPSRPTPVSTHLKMHRQRSALFSRTSAACILQSQAEGLMSADAPSQRNLLIYDVVIQLVYEPVLRCHRAIRPLRRAARLQETVTARQD